MNIKHQKLQIAMSSLLFIVHAGMCQDIIGFETSSGITFQSNSTNLFSLEYASTLNGPWTNWGSVSSASLTGTVMTVPTPVFFRISQGGISARPPHYSYLCNYLPTDTVIYFTNGIDCASYVTSADSNLVYCGAGTTRLFAHASVFITYFTESPVVVTSTVNVRLILGNQLGPEITFTNTHIFTGVPSFDVKYAELGEVSMIPTNFGWQYLGFQIREDSICGTTSNMELAVRVGNLIGEQP